MTDASSRGALVDEADLAAVSRWQAPEVTAPCGVIAGGGAVSTRAEAAKVTERLAALEAEAREAGYRRGREEGCAEGRAQYEHEAARLRALVEALASQTDVVDDALLQRLAALVRTAVRQLVRRELRAQPDEIVSVIRDGLAALPDPQAQVVVRLHPDDAGLVRRALGAGDGGTWQLVEDPTVTAGGAWLDTGTSTLDATLERRLEALLGRLLPDTRAESGHD